MRQQDHAKVIIATKTKIYKHFILFLFLCGIPCQAKTIIFDLSGVLFEHSRWGIAKEIGLWNFVKYAFQEHKIPFEAYNTLLNVMYSTGSQSIDRQNPPAMHKGKELPLIMCQWLCSTKTNEQVKHEVFQAIERYTHQGLFASEQEKQLVKKIASVIFSPEIMTQYVNPISSGIDILKQCKQCGHTILILSNWDNESFQLLKAKYADFFDTYIDGIVISGAANIQDYKPHHTIYKKLIKLYGLTPEECIFIDDQQENIYGAQQCNITGILYNDSKTVAKQLEALHVFTDP